MVYECDKCSSALPPGVTSCPKCGERFDDAVPLDASDPASGFSARPTKQQSVSEVRDSTKLNLKLRAPLVAPIILLFLVGLGVAIYFAMVHADPHNLKVTEANKTTFTDTIKDSKGLTVDENRMLMAYMIRYSVVSSFGHDETLSPVGKTVGELIDNERNFEVKQKQEEANQERLAANAKAKEDALHALLRDSITLTLTYKNFVAADYQSNSQDSISFGCEYQNKSKKDIRAFTGVIQFNDLFGRKIKSLHITIDDPVLAGQTGTWSGSYHYNQFIDDDVQLKNADFNDIRIVWLPNSILYIDGTSVGDATTGDNPT